MPTVRKFQRAALLLFNFGLVSLFSDKERQLSYVAPSNKTPVSRLSMDLRFAPLDEPPKNVTCPMVMPPSEGWRRAGGYTTRPPSRQAIRLLRYRLLKRRALAAS